jgi:putative nucleotidyltransferase with HDIG domain
MQLLGDAYLSLPMNSMYLGDGYLLRSVQNLEAASRPVQTDLRRVFLITGLGALLAALTLGALSSRSIVQPIAAVVARLRESERSGVIAEFGQNFAPVQEIRELTQSFDRAAAGIRQGRENLQRAYVEFVASLASALDARDPYTAGHSCRVSELSGAVARAMDASTDEIEEIRIGALLHDLGKIGISDTILQKTGGLTSEEFSLIRQHPSIGRKILETVQAFHVYRPIVELHHENWDGSGYPWGMRGQAVPLGARIVHVADAYDAMTSDRPYRRGMSHEAAIQILEKHAGTQFDPAVVSVLAGIAAPAERWPMAGDCGITVESIHVLAQVLTSHRQRSAPRTMEIEKL